MNILSVLSSILWSSYLKCCFFSLQIFEGICQLDPRSELWKPYATVCSDYPNILKGLLDSAVHTKNSDKAATHFSTLTSLVKETQDLTVPTLDMMWKEILTGGHRIIDRDSRIQHIQVGKQTEQVDVVNVVTERASLSIAFLYEV